MYSTDKYWIPIFEKIFTSGSWDHIVYSVFYKPFGMGKDADLDKRELYKKRLHFCSFNKAGVIGRSGWVGWLKRKNGADEYMAFCIVSLKHSKREKA